MDALKIVSFISSSMFSDTKMSLVNNEIEYPRNVEIVEEETSKPGTCNSTSSQPKIHAVVT